MRIKDSQAGLALTTTSTSPKISDKDVASENILQNMVAYFQNLLSFEDISYHYNPNNLQKTRRKAIRFRPNGIVALTTLEQPIVTNICDIASGGVAFWHQNERDITNSEFKMDILIFDCQTYFEYFIGQAKGRVKSKELVSDPENKTASWRFGVEFLDLDSLTESILQPFCCVVSTANAQFQSECLPKILSDT